MEVTRRGHKLAKFQAIDEYRSETTLSVEGLCEILKVSKSGYYKWLNHEKQAYQTEDDWLMEKIRLRFIDSNGVLGYRQMCIHINRDHNTNYSPGKIRRLMRLLGLKSHIRRAKGYSTQASERNLEPNLLNQNFQASQSNEKWVTDVTHLFYGGHKKAYLSVIKDLYDGSIIAYQVSQRNDNPLVLDTIKQAIEANPGATPIIHSDRGSQYTSGAYRKVTNELGWRRSMSRTGNCYDNAVIESFFGTFKCECYHYNYFPTYKDLTDEIDAFMDRYNNRRYQSKLNNLAPIEFRNKIAA